MKEINKIAVLSAMAALSAALAIPARAADSSTSSSTTSMTSDKTFQVERANKLVGKEVQDSQNQKAGKIDNIVVDLESGRIIYAVIGSGGVLGAGEKKYAVPPQIFQTGSPSSLKLTVDKQKLTSAPEFTKDMDKDTELGKGEFVSKVYDAFGQSNFWKALNATPSNGEFHNVHKVTDLIGMKINNVSDQSIGKVENVILNLPAGRVAYVILSPDSSLGLGNNYYALPPDALTLSSDKKTLTSDITKDKLAAAPHFTRDNWATISDPAWAAQVYQYYGKQAWFTSGGSGTTLQPTGRNNSQEQGTSPSSK
jgi:sporulation protein YlmC with PRC-barrel domain